MISDKSYRNKMVILKGRTLSVFHKSNPGIREFSGSSSADSEYQIRKVGDQLGNCCSTEVCVAPGDFSIINIDDHGYDPPPSPYFPTYDMYFDITWNAAPNAISYTVSVDYTNPYLVVNTGTYSATLYVDYIDDTTAGITITAVNSCGQSQTTGEAAPCFLAGSLVQMADDSVKAIEDVLVGDLVLGAFGEINSVLALHRPLLGDKLMCRINDEHSTTNHHPHVSVDKKFYCNDPFTVDEKTYGRNHMVINENGEVVEMFLHGLKKGRTQQLELSVELKTVEGSRTVNVIDTYSLPPETQLYNLVTGGSHTYHVDGYAVTGWPREDNFDYDKWLPK